MAELAQGRGMDLADYAALDATALATLVAAGQVSAHEVATTALRAIAQVNPALNAVVETYPERVPAAGARPGGALAGVPFLVKDFPFEGGTPSELGCELARGLVMPQDQHAMRRLRHAGVSVLGRTTSSEMAMAALTVNRLNGITRNPWDLLRSTAGSSGGAAAIVAAGAVPLAHGTDAGGSIRNPSSHCGLVGLKPSRGRVSPGPDWGHCMAGLSTHFVLTRTVRDCALALDVMAGTEPGDCYAIAPPAAPYVQAVRQAPSALRIALNDRVWSGLRLDPEVAAALDRAGVALQSLGHEVEEASPDFDYAAYLSAQIDLWAVLTAQGVDDIARATGRVASPDTLLATTWAMVQAGRALPGVRYVEAELAYNRTVRDVVHLWDDFDILVTPTNVTLPAPLDAVDLDLPHATAGDLFDMLAPVETFTALFNATGQPALSLPLMLSAGGLPIGIQLVARFGAEDVLLRLAAQLEDALPWSGRRPPVHVAA
ncbi:amidase [Zavarzinia sp. CC-PAN008]|uniref:amidase n=1 Tax=Zavarzinia sp. CC-PAN008 TaxID=3243332 RepID=UPI003F74A030